MSLTEAHQESNGAIGGGNFDAVITNANGDKTHVHTSVGSGNLLNLSQHASGQDSDYTMGYEYMPVRYSTGIYDTRYMEGSSDIFSNKKSLANRVIADNCEHMKIIYRASLNEDPLINTSVNAIAGPLKVSSFIGTGDHRLNTTADVAAGIASIDQLINLAEAHQDAIGVIGGGNFDTAITNSDRKITGAHTVVGSGNLINLSQFASLKDARYKVEYEYMPTSYSTGTYDKNLNTSKTEGI
jgi:hypothetical protein